MGQTQVQHIVTDLTDEIAEVLEAYARNGSVDARDLPLSNPFFDSALRKLGWRIGRTLGQETDRFYALLRDTATGCLNGERDNLFYLIVAGRAEEVQRYLHDDIGVTAYCEALRSHHIVGRETTLRMASYTLGLADVVSMTPGQIGRMGQQFYDPTAAFGLFKGQILPPAADPFILRVLVGKRSRHSGSEPDWFDGTYDPYREAHWETATRRPLGTRTLTVQACRSWSDLAITVAHRHVMNVLSGNETAMALPIDRAQTRIEGFTHPDGHTIEITVMQSPHSFGPVEIPAGLVRHNRYGFHQLLLQLAPLHMDGEAIC